MTTGSRTRDNRRFGAVNVGTWIGSYSTKSWVGGDQAPRVKRPPRRFRVVKRYEIVRGRRRLVSKQRFPIYSEPPKRARLGEHSYDMTALDQVDGYLRVNSSGQIWTMSSFAGSATVGLPGASYWPSWSQENLLDANDQIKLIGKLREKLQGSDFNLSVFLGEGHQTLKMIGDTALTLGSAIRRLKKGDLPGAARALGVNGPKRRTARQTSVDNLSGRWLELQYGWLPLLKDMEEGAKQLAHHLNVPFSSTYRASVRREISFNLSGNPTGSTSWKGNVRKSHRRSLIARISEPLSVPQLSGLLDPELVAWELLPFSFVADWALPIGDWLSARALVRKLTGTFITSEKRIGARDVTGVGGGVTTFGEASQHHFASARFIRTISSELSVPKPTFKGLDKALSFQHCLNGLALMAQAFSGIKPRW